MRFLSFWSYGYNLYCRRTNKCRTNILSILTSTRTNFLWRNVFWNLWQFFRLTIKRGVSRRERSKGCELRKVFWYIAIFRVYCIRFHFMLCVNCFYLFILDIFIFIKYILETENIWTSYQLRDKYNNNNLHSSNPVHSNTTW